MKQYLVIGGSSGIGNAITRQLQSEQCNVFASYHNNKKDSYSTVQYFYLDVLDPAPAPGLLPEVLDGLVYCPGTIMLKPFARIKPEDYLQDYQLQVLGAIRIIQQVLPNLKNSTGASIVLFSTVAVQTGFNFHSIIASSKGAIEGLTRSLAAELAPKIRVNCIAPSITNTPLAETLINTPEKKEANAQRHPLKKIGTPADIAAMACFLLGDQSGWITGQVIHVDGGISTLKTS